MSEMRTLLHFELKKILQRKSTWITTGVLLFFLLAVTTAGYFGSSYIEGEFYESHADAYRIDRENGLALSGQKIDEALIQKVDDAFSSIQQEEGFGYMLTERYKTEIRPYEELYFYLTHVSTEVGLDMADFYEARNQVMETKWKNYQLTEAEKDYWRAREAKLEKPFTYEYCKSYEDNIYMGGAYMVCLIISFFISICISGVFTEEHGRKTDQLILCARLGRKEEYAAKMLAGSIVTFAVTLIFWIITMACQFAMYGPEGFDAVIQLIMPEASHNVTVGQVAIYGAVIVCLSSVMVSCFTMMLSELIRSNIGAMAVILAVVFLARLVVIPSRMRVLSQLWNYLPINFLKIDQGLLDCRLVTIFGLQLNSWQVAPILYIILTVLFILIGKRVYCNYQVSGR